MKLITDTSEGLRELREKFASVKRYGKDYETFPKTPQRTKDLRKAHSLHHDLLDVLGVGFGFEDGSKTYIPLKHRHGDNAPYAETMELLEKVEGDPDLECWAHNAKFEYMVSRVLGFTPKNDLRCSQIAQWLIGGKLDRGRGLKLKPAAQYYLKHKMTEWDEVVPKGTRAEDTPIKIMGRYCADDGLQCLRLGLHFIERLRELRLVDVFTRLEMPFMPVLAHMQEVGFLLDTDYLNGLHNTFSAEMEDLAASFEDIVGVGITQNQQISKALYDDLKWWPSDGFEKGKNGHYSIDSKHREVLLKKLEKDSTPRMVLELKERYQKVAKLDSTYTFSLADKALMHADGRVRGSMMQTGTETGRLASAGPNLQNIPSRTEAGRMIRNAFISEPGWVLCDADYSQADLVMMGHLSQDPMLLKAYREGLDLHQQTADECSLVTGMDIPRSLGKVLNLGLIYEMGPKTLMQNVGMDNYRVAEKIWNAWHQTYPLVGVYHKRMHAFARKHGFVRTITGRLRLIKEIHSKTPWIRAKNEKFASNTPDQGSVADMIKIAKRNMLQEWKERGVLYDYYTGEGKVKILSQVHDEVICEFREDFKQEGLYDIRRHMEQAVELRAPMTAMPGLGRTWNEAKLDVKRREELVAQAKQQTDPSEVKRLIEESMAA